MSDRGSLDRKVMAVVELKAFIENVLGQKEQPYDRRTAWDTVWQEILKVIVDRGHLPEGTVHDIIPVVQEYIEEKEKHHNLFLADERSCSFLSQVHGSNTRCKQVQSKLVRLAATDSAGTGLEQPCSFIFCRFLEQSYSRKEVDALLSTIQERCPSYLSSNRELSLVFSELWGDVTFQDGRHTYFHRQSKGNPQHAEIQVLSYLSELQDGHRPRSVHLYMNVSPCRNCADAVVRFHRSNGDISLALTFSSLYAHHGENHRQGLQALAESGIQLAVFNENQWEALAHCIQVINPAGRVV
uniref:CMP/dCMP-type deaminase domain-containing protein n=1 Tax=Timema poppense TaxID=170557 RepID=A0A7R9CZ59_TIMPO|nr:unnamed protein product [Timema poppensis]